MAKKNMVAMILAGGQGSRLGLMTKQMAKPAVPFGGKYRIIDFALSNCCNSGIDTVGILTQYKPQMLNAHIGIGTPWDFDRVHGGIATLPWQGAVILVLISMVLTLIAGVFPSRIASNKDPVEALNIFDIDFTKRKKCVIINV